MTLEQTVDFDWIDTLKESDHDFEKAYRKSSTHFQKAKKEQTLLSVMIPSVLRKNNAENIRNIEPLEDQLRAEIKECKERNNFENRIKLAILVAGYERYIEIKSQKGIDPTYLCKSHRQNSKSGIDLELMDALQREIERY